MPRLYTIYNIRLLYIEAVDVIILKIKKLWNAKLNINKKKYCECTYRVNVVRRVNYRVNYT